tara:strand:+ start:699843 stop:700076 length:234 start_codon:yes stop_codon:yes gene_type:complete
MKIDDALFMKAFNNGYFLAENNPLLLDTLFATPSNNSYINAMRDGEKVYLKTRQKIRNEELARIKSRDITRKKDIEK